MSRKRVVVTGIGTVSCFGNDVDSFYQNLLAGKSGIEKISSFDTEGLATQFAGKINNFDSEGYLEKKMARRVDPYIAYAIVAAKKAMEKAQFSMDALDINSERAGCIIGSGMGGMSYFTDGVLTLDKKGANRVSPFFVPYILTNMSGALVGKEFGFMGPNYSISTACATGNNSIIAAAEHIATGQCDLMITGGVEAPIIPLSVAGFNACKALSKRNQDPHKASRPWDKDRDGFVLGEGAGVLVLETLEHATKRGAPILAEYLGGGALL